jgi:hypothetical protein
MYSNPIDLTLVTDEIICYLIDSDFNLLYTFHQFQNKTT